MTSDWVRERIEPVARAMCVARDQDPDHRMAIGSNARRDYQPMWKLYRDTARDFLVALEVAIQMDRKVE